MTEEECQRLKAYCARDVKSLSPNDLYDLYFLIDLELREIAEQLKALLK